MRRILIGASRHIEYDMRNDFFAHLERLPLAYFQAHRTGDLMSRATNDLNAVRMMIGPSVMYSANTVLRFVVAIAVMMSIDCAADALVADPAAVRLDLGQVLRQRDPQALRADPGAAVRSQRGRPGSAVWRARRARLRPGSVPRSSGSASRTTSTSARNRGLITLQGFFFPSMAFFLGLGALVALWLGSREVISGRITIGEFVAFNAYLTMLSWPMIAFGWVTNMLQRGMASWKRMLEVLETEPAIADSVGHPFATADHDAGQVPGSANRAVEAARHTRAIRGEIEFRDLVFGYDGKPVLDRVSLKIEAGQTVALGRAHRLGEVDADQPAPATGRSAARYRVRRRGRRAGFAPCRAPRCDRVRSARAVSLLRHTGRQRRVRVGRHCGRDGQWWGPSGSERK